MRKARRRCCASARIPIARIAAIAAAAVSIAAIARIAATVPIARRAARAMTPSQEPSDVDRPSPSLLSPPQDLPVLRTQRAEDRLQGHAAALALYFRAR